MNGRKCSPDPVGMKREDASERFGGSRQSQLPLEGSATTPGLSLAACAGRNGRLATEIHVLPVVPLLMQVIDDSFNHASEFGSAHCGVTTTRAVEGEVG